MSRNYDNWERLVAAVIKKQQLWELFHAHSRSPSVLSDTSGFSSLQHRSKKSAGIVFISEIRPVFNFENLMRAQTKNLGRGTFGRVYTATLANGTTIVVKRLKMVTNSTKQDYEKHMEIVGDVEHENVAALRAYYYSQKKKLMIYDYYSGGSVSVLLHGKTGKYQALVDWQTRFRIALGAARGISHIHTRNGGKMVHGNIKASNIFLNSQDYGVVSDLGLASMVQTTFPKSSRCYAPEVKSTRNVSQASDVYSFGVLLLQLVTRKSPEPSRSHNAVDLVNLVNSVSSKELNAKIFDEDLLLNPSIREEIARVLELAISCVAKSPKKRPKMSEVVEIIHGIGTMRLVAAMIKWEEFISDFDLGFVFSSSFRHGQSPNSEFQQGASQIEKVWTEMYEPGFYVTIIAFSEKHLKRQEAHMRRNENQHKVYERYCIRPTSRSTKVFRSPGVYITLGVFNIGGTRDTHRVRYSQRHFKEQEANIWWKNHYKVYEACNVRLPSRVPVEEYEPGINVTLGAFNKNGTRDFERVLFSARIFNEHEVDSWWLKNRENVLNSYNKQVLPHERG